VTLLGLSFVNYRDKFIITAQPTGSLANQVTD
jgi:hypothetical protein